METTFTGAVQTEGISGDTEARPASFFVENKTLLGTSSRNEIGSLELLKFGPVVPFGQSGSSVAMFQRPWGLAWKHPPSETHAKASQRHAKRKGLLFLPSAPRYVIPEQGASLQAMSVNSFQFKPVFFFGQKGSSVGMFYCP